MEAGLGGIRISRRWSSKAVSFKQSPGSPVQKPSWCRAGSASRSLPLLLGYLAALIHIQEVGWRWGVIDEPAREDLLSAQLSRALMWRDSLQHEERTRLASLYSPSPRGGYRPSNHPELWLDAWRAAGSPI